MPPEEVSQWLNKNFPKPRVDPDWLEGCCEWLMDDQNISPVTAFPQFIERVKEQLLESDLADSMLADTGFHPGIHRATEKLQGPPMLVQITAITEIGVSAFQLEQTRAAREERLLSGVGNIEGEEDGDVEVEGEGPMPKYPRGTLRFQLSDGKTVINAMEYRPLHQLSLGVTELGYKMQLKGTRIQNGMAFLEPATVTLLGGRYAELEARQLSDFKKGLRTRLGRPLTPEPAAPADQEMEPTVDLQATRSPLREISPPPVLDFVQQHADDIDMEPRRRLPAGSTSVQSATASTTLAPGHERIIASLPSRHSRVASGSNLQDEPEIIRRTTQAQRATLTYVGLSNAENASNSRYFDETNNKQSEKSSSRKMRDLAINAALEDADFSFTPTPRQLARIIPPASPSYDSPSADYSTFDFELLDELVTDENKHPLQNAASGRAPEQEPLFLPETQHEQPEPGNASDDYDMSDFDYNDPTLWDHVDKATAGNKTASENNLVIMAEEAQTAGRGSTSSTATPAPYATQDVIEIDDSDDSDAENKENQPVPARHVRQRMNNDHFGTNLVSGGGFPPMSQRTGRPVIQASNPEDVIDLSDSD